MPQLDPNIFGIVVINTGISFIAVMWFCYFWMISKFKLVNNLKFWVKKLGLMINNALTIATAIKFTSNLMLLFIFFFFYNNIVLKKVEKLVLLFSFKHSNKFQYSVVTLL